MAASAKQIKKELQDATLDTLLEVKEFVAEEIEKRQSALPPEGLVTFTDGAARGNPGPGGAGVLLFDASGKKIMEDCLYLGEVTNNEAEYRALLLALKHAAERTKGKVSCVMDSELLVRQLNGIYQVKSEKLLGFYHEVKNKISQFEEVTFSHVPREHPRLQMADKLANKAIDDFNKKGEPYGR